LALSGQCPILIRQCPRLLDKTVRGDKVFAIKAEQDTRVRFVVKSVRTSHRPFPSGRQSGIPTGHRHCARNRFFPMA
jgi:hypothetical protein